MATGSGSRDVTLTLSVDTVGEDGIRQLQQQFEALAAEGTAAGPEFKALADQLTRLGDQNAALGAFKELVQTTENLRAEQAAAGFALDATATKLTELKQASAEAAASQKAAAVAIVENSKAFELLKGQIDVYKSDLGGVSKMDAEQREELGRKKATLLDVKVAFIDLREAQKSANAEAKNYETAFTSLSNKFNQAEIAAEKLANSVRRQEEALAAAATQAETLGVSTQSVATAEELLLAAFNASAEALEKRRQSAIALDLAQDILTTAMERQTVAAAALIVEEQRLAAQQEASAVASVQSAEEMAAASQAAAQQINTAFKTIGVRSAQELQAEIQQVRQAMDTLRASSTNVGSTLSGAFAQGETKIKALELQLRELNGTLTLGDKAAKLFSNSMGQFAAGNLIAAGVGVIINKIAEMGRAFVDVNLESQRLTKALAQVYGSSVTAASQFDFLRQISDKSGVSIRGLSDEFLRFSAATQTSNISLAASNGVFAQVTRAAGVLGLQSEQVAGILNALGQMASKGAVQMEELRGQLGDRLPGALGIAAKGLGVTQAELIKLVESGTLAAKTFFPAFEKGLADTFGGGTTKIEGFIQGWNRLTNAIVKAGQAASEGTAFNNLGKAFDFVATNINVVVKSVELLAARFAILKIADFVTSFFTLGNAAKKTALDIDTATAATTANTLATTKNTSAAQLSTAAKVQNAAAWTAMGSQIAATTGKIDLGTKAIETTTVATNIATVAKNGFTTAIGLAGRAASGLVSALGGPIGALLTLALYSKEAGTFIGETAAKMVGWGKVLDDNEKKLKAIADAEAKANEARRQADAAQDLANTKAAARAVAAVKQAELEVVTSQKEFQAAQQKLAFTEDIIKLQGLEQEGAKALVFESLELVASAEKERDAKEKLARAAQLEIDAINKTRNAYDQITAAQKDQIAKLEELAKTHAAEALKQQEIVRQLQVETAERRINSQALQDNSGRVKELTQDYENAKAKLEILRSVGTTSLVDLQKAEIDLAAATKIKNNAIQQSIDLINRKAAADQAALAITSAGLNVSQKNYELLAKQSLAQGDYAQSVYYSIEAKKAERAILETTIKVKQLELDTEKATLEVQRANITATDSVSTAKKEDLRIRLELIKAKQVELNGTKDGIRVLDAEIRGLIAGTSATKDNTKALSDQTAVRTDVVRSINQDTGARAYLTRQMEAETDALEKQNAAIERQNAAQEKAIELENKRLNQDKEHFELNTAGQRTLVDAPSERSVFDSAKGQGLTDAQALKIAQQFIQNGQQVGATGANTSLGENWGTELQKAINEMVLENARMRAASDQKGLPPAGAAPTPSQAAPILQPLGAAQPTPIQTAPVTNLTIHLNSGVDVSSRAGVESLARAIMPAINTLNRRGTNFTGA